MKTAEGKERSSRNSTGSGLHAKSLYPIRWGPFAESEEEITAFVASIVASLSPRNVFERGQVDQIALTQWQLHRAARRDSVLRTGAAILKDHVELMELVEATRLRGAALYDLAGWLVANSTEIDDPNAAGDDDELAVDYEALLGVLRSMPQAAGAPRLAASSGSEQVFRDLIARLFPDCLAAGEAVLDEFDANEAKGKLLEAELIKISAERELRHTEVLDRRVGQLNRQLERQTAMYLTIRSRPLITDSRVIESDGTNPLEPPDSGS